MKPVATTIKNPTANAIVERIHLVMGNMTRSQLATEKKFDDPVADMTAACAWAIRSTISTVTKHSPGQLVFNQDMILRIEIAANWHAIQTCRRKAQVQNNRRENKRRIAWTYEPGQQVLLLSGRNGVAPKLQLHQGPYDVISYDSNSGTLKINRGNYTENVNIRRCRPYFKSL